MVLRWFDGGRCGDGRGNGAVPGGAHSLRTSYRSEGWSDAKKASRRVQERWFQLSALLRLTPIFPFTLVNIAPALANLPLRSYVLATFFGIAPGTFAYAFVGSGLDSVIMAQEAANPGCAAAGTCSIDLGSLVTTEIILAFAALGTVALIPPVMKAIRARSLGKAT